MINVRCSSITSYIVTAVHIVKLAQAQVIILPRGYIGVCVTTTTTTTTSITE